MRELDMQGDDRMAEARSTAAWRWLAAFRGSVATAGGKKSTLLLMSPFFFLKRVFFPCFRTPLVTTRPKTRLKKNQGTKIKTK
jgi:hypothetical protein